LPLAKDDLSKGAVASGTAHVSHKLPDLLKQRYDRYIARAQSAEAQAGASADPLVRESWRRVAEGWRELAAKLLRGSRL